jgi:NAD(P)-dependent dehydrogenase (short-subunit alcohol dehydrogenase family)
VDMGDEASVMALIEATVSLYGGLDILHNNAPTRGSVPRRTCRSRTSIPGCGTPSCASTFVGR